MPDQYQEARLIDASKKWYAVFLKKITLSNGKTYIVDLDQNIFLILFPFLFFWIPIKANKIKDQNFLPKSKTNRNPNGIDWFTFSVGTSAGPALNILTSWMNISVPFSVQITMLIISISVTFYFRFIFIRKQVKMPSKKESIKIILKRRWTIGEVLTYLLMYPILIYYFAGGVVLWFRLQNVPLLFLLVPYAFLSFTSFNAFAFHPGYYKVKIIKS